MLQNACHWHRSGGKSWFSKQNVGENALSGLMREEPFACDLLSSVSKSLWRNKVFLYLFNRQLKLLSAWQPLLAVDKIVCWGMEV